MSGPLLTSGVCVSSLGTKSPLGDLHWLVVGKPHEMHRFLLEALGVGVGLTSASPTSLPGWPARFQRVPNMLGSERGNDRSRDAGDQPRVCE